MVFISISSAKIIRCTLSKLKLIFVVKLTVYKKWCLSPRNKKVQISSANIDRYNLQRLKDSTKDKGYSAHCYLACCTLDGTAKVYTNRKSTTSSAENLKSFHDDKQLQILRNSGNFKCSSLDWSRVCIFTFPNYERISHFWQRSNFNEFIIFRADEITYNIEIINNEIPRSFMHREYEGYSVSDLYFYDNDKRENNCMIKSEIN